MKNRVLVISVSSWNEKVGSNTWKELLSFLDDSKIGCITFRPGSPEKKYSENYLIYDERKIIQSIFNKKITPCYIYDETNRNIKADDETLNYYKNKERFTFVKRIIREIAWKLSKWKNKTLKKFITEFNPTHVVYFMDGYIHANRMCRYVKKITNAKSIGYFVDDTFSFKQRNNLLFYLLRFFQRQSLKRLVRVTDSFWSINGRMKIEVYKAFNIESTIVTKPLLKSNHTYCKKDPEFPLRVVYAGNLAIGRLDSLKFFIKSLKMINKNRDYFELDVYSSTPTKIGSCEPFIRFHRPINQDKVFEKYMDADILLFLESTRRSFAKVARLSFSTKITDYLSCNKPIIAIGSEGCFPISYLVENNAALFAKNEKEMNVLLRRIIDDSEILNAYACNAYRLGIENHSRESISSVVRSFFN